MKFLLFVITIIAFPVMLLAQDDWCTCMETTARYDDVSNFVSQTNNQLMMMTSSTASTSFAQDAELLPSAPELPTIPVKVESEEDIESAVEKEPIKTVSTARKAAMKKRKKLFKRGVKKRKRAKKYRGRCPIF